MPINTDNLKTFTADKYAMVRMFQDILNAGALIETCDKLLTEFEASFDNDFLQEVRSILNIWLMINHPEKKFVYHF